MVTLSGAALLQVWEQCQHLHPVDRAVRLLAAGCPDLPPAEIAELSIGQRDARLLALHEDIFGPELDSAADCPECGERLEFAFETATIRAEPPSSAPSHVIYCDGRSVGVRRLNSYDLAAAAAVPSPEEGRRLLAERCLVDADGVDLSDDLLTNVADALADMDPQAEILLDLACPSCGRTWQLAFDIVSYLWREISAEALRLLQQVHTLARAYGWREADILSMSAARRHAYIEMSV